MENQHKRCSSHLEANTIFALSTAFTSMQSMRHGSRRGYAGAVALYRKILDHLLDDTLKGVPGYVDLGMAYERGTILLMRTRASSESENAWTVTIRRPICKKQSSTPVCTKWMKPTALSARPKSIFTREIKPRVERHLHDEREYEANPAEKVINKYMYYLTDR